MTHLRLRSLTIPLVGDVLCHLYREGQYIFVTIPENKIGGIRKEEEEEMAEEAILSCLFFRK